MPFDKKKAAQTFIDSQEKHARRLSKKTHSQSLLLVKKK